MNLYMLVEGKRTEKKIYPEWLHHTVPHLVRVYRPEDAITNNFYIISGNGYPSILTHTQQAVETINSLGGLYDHFAVIVDCEDVDIESRREEISDIISSNRINSNVNTFIIIQNCCIETWLLGNRKFIQPNPTLPELINCVNYYNVRLNDPEDMNKPEWHSGTTASFHDYYLDKIFKGRTGGHMVYNKNSPGEATKRHYLNSLVKRYTTDSHINTFGELLHFLRYIDPDCM